MTPKKARKTAFVVVMKQGESGDEYSQVLRAIADRNREVGLDYVISDAQTKFDILNKYCGQNHIPIHVLQTRTRLLEVVESFSRNQLRRGDNLAYVTKGQAKPGIHRVIDDLARDLYEVTIKYL